MTTRLEELQETWESLKEDYDLRMGMGELADEALDYLREWEDSSDGIEFFKLQKQKGNHYDGFGFYEVTTK